MSHHWLDDHGKKKTERTIKETEVESYLVKVYRRQNPESKAAAGIVEEIETGKKHIYSNADELWRIINSMKINSRTQESRICDLP